MEGKQRSAAEIREELREAEERERASLEARRKATPVRRKFTIFPAHKVSGHELYDDTCKFYVLHGEVTNRTEAISVGHSNHDLRDGGMVYAYNTRTGSIICSVGGGMLWVARSWDNADDRSDVKAMREISAYIHFHPDGGDITDIVVRHRQRRGY